MLTFVTNIPKTIKLTPIDADNQMVRGIVLVDRDMCNDKRLKRRKNSL